MAQLNVCFSHLELSAAHTAVIVDVLRASSTIATALAHGAAAIIPMATPEEAIGVRERFPAGEALASGERNAVRVPGFDLGNSPLEFTRQAVAGRTIAMTTTNGTAALLNAAAKSGDVLVGSYVNFSVVLSAVRSALRRDLDVAIVCAGNNGRFSLEDAACAGHFVRYALQHWGKGPPELNDAARAALTLEMKYAEDTARLFADARHGRTLRTAGFGADLVACGTLDACPVVPSYQNGRIERRD